MLHSKPPIFIFPTKWYLILFNDFSNHTHTNRALPHNVMRYKTCNYDDPELRYSCLRGPGADIGFWKREVRVTLNYSNALHPRVRA